MIGQKKLLLLHLWGLFGDSLGLTLHRHHFLSWPQFWRAPVVALLYCCILTLRHFMVHMRPFGDREFQDCGVNGAASLWKSLLHMCRLNLPVLMLGADLTLAGSLYVMYWSILFLTLLQWEAWVRLLDSIWWTWQVREVKVPWISLA